MDFGYRFYAETVIVITYCDFLAIQQADTNTEQVLVDIGKVGDVVGILSVRVALHLLISLLCHLFYLRYRNLFHKIKHFWIYDWTIDDLRLKALLEMILQRYSNRKSLHFRDTPIVNRQLSNCK